MVVVVVAYLRVFCTKRPATVGVVSLVPRPAIVVFCTKRPMVVVRVYNWHFFQNGCGYNNM
jgi:hypothetical protein